MSVDIDTTISSDVYIFERTFLVRTTHAATLDPIEVEMFGIVSTGVKNYDPPIERPTTCYLSIAKMATIFDKGHPIALINKADVKRVYEYIQYHLESWMSVLANGINAIEAPFDDLLILDRFASSVYGVAAYHYDSKPNTNWGLFMDQFQHLTADAFSGYKPEAVERDIPARTSLTDALLEQQARLLR